jgi:3'-phosphoadenosine 5'-phosphosulfate sulfotransferase (PAPS reductase)/FAD synthetase
MKLDDRVKSGDTIVVWFSCGAASAVAAKVIIDLYGHRCNIKIVNNPIKEEDKDNLRFLGDVEDWLNYDIQFATNPKYPDNSCISVWEDRRFMSGPMGAPCTIELKKKARQLWEKDNPHEWLVLGFTCEEEKRAARFKLTERDNLLTPLIDNGIDKDYCYSYLKSSGVEPPAIYKRGYPNANCIGCVKASSPTYWNLVRKDSPEVFEARAKQSREIGSKLAIVKGVRTYLDELDPEAVGRPLKTLDFECGIFCEEQFELTLEGGDKGMDK